ncbi:MAG TPA: hypothetical protein VE544_03045 [Nitrososphaeraceae archaeon]|nr:hypothetical protein [Nitrososphaeraceae archaeon]
MEVNRSTISYNMPRRREALLDIRRLIVEEGLSHSEIQLRLNLSSSTYFRYLDLLFKAEQEAISGNVYTYQRLLNETLILNQRYLSRARKLTAIGDNENVDAEQRIEAHKFAAQLERAAHDMTYFAPSYLKVQGLLPPPEPKKGNAFPALSMSAIEDEEKDPLERQRMNDVGKYRRTRQRRLQHQQEEEEEQEEGEGQRSKND